MPSEASEGLILFRRENDKVLYLLLHYESGHWGFIKGKIEEGEDPKDTAIRECEEETGIKDVNLIGGFRENINYFFKRNGQTIRKDVNYIIGETNTKEVKISHEHQNHIWLTYKEAMSQLTFINAKNILKSSYNFLKEKGIEK